MSTYSLLNENIPEGFYPGTWPRLKKGNNFITNGNLYKATDDAYYFSGYWIVEAEDPSFLKSIFKIKATDLGYAASLVVDCIQDTERV